MILLTGASGYLGRHVAHLLYLNGQPHITPTRREFNLTDPGGVQQLVRCNVFGAIIHCAAIVPRELHDYDDQLCAEDSLWMTELLAWYARSRCPIVFASSMTAALKNSAYARGKAAAEAVLATWPDKGHISMRLPGLFGLPRRSGVIYEAARSGQIPASFGPYPAMHVQDAAEYLVRAATMPSDGKSEPYSVVYGDPRLEATYGSLGVTFEQRVRHFREELR